MFTRNLIGRVLRLGLMVSVATVLNLEPVQAQTGDDALRFTQRFPATSTRMMSMGGAGIAGVADYGASFTNPAGLGYMRRSTFSGSLNIFSTKDDGLYQVSGFSNGLDTDVSKTQIGHLASVYKVPTVRGAFVVTASFSQVNSFDRDLLFEGENAGNSITDFFMPLPGEFSIEEDADGLYPVFSRPLSLIAYETFGIDFDQGLYDDGNAVPFLPAVTDGTVLQNGSVTEAGSMNELNFGGAAEVAPRVMAGVSINIPFGTYRFDRVFEEDDFQNANDGNFGTTDFEYLRLSEYLKTSLVGVNVRAGLSTDVTPNVRLGLTVETPTYYAVDEDYDTRLETFFDNGDSFSYGDEREEDAGAGNFEYDITTPWRLGAGVAYNIGTFTVLGDIEYVDWSQLQLDASSVSFSDENRFIRQNYNAVVNTRVGVEYTTGPFAVRGGFAFQPDPLDKRIRSTDELDLDRSRTFFSAGLGYRFAEQFQVDLGWMQEQYEDQYRPYTEVTNAPVVSEELMRNRFSLALKLFF